MNSKEVKELHAFRYQDVVLTGRDGYSVYATALIFIEDLSMVEEAIHEYNEMFVEETFKGLRQSVRKTIGRKQNTEKNLFAG